eukprot:16427-Hanusia_phi.AAC.1
MDNNPEPVRSRPVAAVPDPALRHWLSQQPLASPLRKSDAITARAADNEAAGSLSRSPSRRRGRGSFN